MSLLESTSQRSNNQGFHFQYDQMQGHATSLRFDPQANPNFVIHKIKNQKITLKINKNNREKSQKKQ